jgi:hypothetical protein
MTITTMGMTSMSERAAEIRRFTSFHLDKRGISFARPKLRRYAELAAEWEAMRMRLHDSTPDDDDEFLALSAALRGIVAVLRLPLICTPENANGDGVAGITDRNGFLSGDSQRIVYDSWSDAAAAVRAAGSDRLRHARES